MTRLLLSIDRLFSATRPAWIGLGQVGIAVLGVHLAADRLDDCAYHLLLWLNGPLSVLLDRFGLAGLDPEQLVSPATWTAGALELLADLFLLGALTLTPHTPRLSWQHYKERLTVRALVLPVFWAPVCLAGAWVVGMATEDLLAGWNASAARLAGWSIAAVVAWRLGWTGWRRVVGGLDMPSNTDRSGRVFRLIPRWRLDGLAWAPLLLVLAALAVRHGLPLWWWLE